MLVPVILSGGAGTRLWPLSRELYPKQLLPLVSSRTMLQETVLRLDGLDATAPIVVSNEAHRFLVAEQLREIDCQPRAILLEPKGRNTAPAVALAAHAALAEDEGDSLLLVLPADHLIRDVPAFHAAVEIAAAAARDGALATFGVVPNAPETGYGYIRRGRARGRVLSHRANSSRNPTWCGRNRILCHPANTTGTAACSCSARAAISRSSRSSRPISPRCVARASRGATRDLDFTRIDASVFDSCRSESIDYAVMEKTADAVVVPLDAGWSDVGSWSSLHDACERDATATRCAAT